MIAGDMLSIAATTGNPTGPETATVVTETHEYSDKDMIYTKLSWTTTLVYFSITSTTKLSILFMYNRLFSIKELFRRLIIILPGVVIGFWIRCTVTDLANCVLMNGLCEALIDILIILLPIKVVLGLRLNTKQKLASAFVFLRSAFVIVSGLLKAIFGYIPGSRQPSFSKP
ncbi:hypothetical protein GX51_06721 [Blastomyces parvus]|uniref:Rhodopsin domain-containing protein n=1 Tax=Blastomyces parvus TaxID=2060905 RepID=A0A2B7WQ02_9EURO|nr:hypothetical protein GX51_06721 [Blastomyces parvus]